MITYLKKIFYSLIFLLPTIVFGAQAYFVPSQTSIGVQKEVLVDVYVDTGVSVVNAVEGSISFPSGVLDVIDIRNGNSAINFWIEQPQESLGGIVSFSGITPGGIFGKLYLFSIVYKTKQDGDAVLRFESMRVLKNNGTGEEIKFSTTPYTLNITHDLDNDPSLQTSVSDTDPPENFKAEIIKNDDIYNGQYAVVFATQDKSSGIDYYEVKEGYWGDFNRAESPYLLVNQSLNKKIYVKAVDKSENKRVVILNPQNPVVWYRDYTILAILLVVFLCGLFLRKIRRIFFRV